jgi:hypothetical protein
MLCGAICVLLPWLFDLLSGRPQSGSGGNVLLMKLSLKVIQKYPYHLMDGRASPMCVREQSIRKGN